MKNKIGPDMLSRRISKQDIQNAKRRTKLLEYLGIIDTNRIQKYRSI